MYYHTGTTARLRKSRLSTALLLVLDSYKNWLLKKNKGLSLSTLLQQVSVISWFYLLADKLDPTQHKLVSTMVSAAERLPREVRRAVPATVAHIELIAAWVKDFAGLAEQCACVMSLALLCSCCLLDDIIRVHCKEVRSLKEGVRMRLPNRRQTSIGRDT